MMFNFILAQVPAYGGQQPYPQYPQLRQPYPQPYPQQPYYPSQSYVGDPNVACKLGELVGEKYTENEQTTWYLLGCLGGFCLGPFGYVVPLFVSEPSPKSVLPITMPPVALQSYERCYRETGKKKMREYAFWGVTTGCLASIPISLMITSGR